MKAADFDAAFDSGEVDMLPFVDLASARRPGMEVERVHVDVPGWMVESLDAEAVRRGVTREAVIAAWIAERLDRPAG